MMNTDKSIRAISISAIVVVALIAMGTSAITPVAAQSSTLVVDGDGSSDGAYATIPDAIDAASQGDTIEVQEVSGGHGQFVVDRDTDPSDLTITAASGASPTISHGANDGTPTVAVDQDGITIEGFTIKRTGSSSTTAQAVRVAGDNVQLTDNTYEVDGENDAAIGILTSSSGAAGNPDVSGVTISSVDISGGSITTTGTTGAPVGVLVADDGAATIEDGAVTISDATFSAAGDNAHVRELDTGSGVVDMSSTLSDNDFGTAATPDATDATLSGYSVDGLITSTVQDSVAAAATDATITVASGTYAESVVIDRDTHSSGLTITAASGSSPTISHGASDGTPTVAVDQDGITIEGFTIERTGSGSNVAQAVRVAGNNVQLTDNTYEVGGTNDAAVAILTDSSGAAGNPDVSGLTISSVSISGGELITNADSQTGLLVADNGAASFQSGAVSASDVTFTANADGDHVLELDTGGGVIDTAATETNNDFDTAAVPDSTDGTLSGFNVDGLIDSTIQGAVTYAADGATVDVVAGTYDEDVKLGKSITLSGAGEDQTTIVGQNNRPGALFVAADHPGLQVTGFRVEAGSSSNAVHLSTGSEITDVTFSQNTFVGADGQVSVFVGGDHEDVDFDDNTFAAASGATPIEHLYVGGEASYGSSDASATSAGTEDDITNNVFVDSVSRSGSGNAIEFEGQHGEITGNDFTSVTTDGAVVAIPGTVGSGNTANIADINGEPVRTLQLHAVVQDNQGVATTDPGIVTAVTLTHSTEKQLDLNVTTTGTVSSLAVDLDGPTTGTGTDVTLGDGEFTETANADGTYSYTASVTGDIASGSSETYQASVTAVNGDSSLGSVFSPSQQRELRVETTQGGSATVSTGSTSVPEVSITLDGGGDSEVTVSSSDTLPDNAKQNMDALVSDIGTVETDDSVVSALNVNLESSVADTPGTLQFTVDKDNIDGEPAGLLVTRYTGTSYESLDTTVVNTAGDTVTLEAETPNGFSLFAVVDTDESAATVPSSDSSGSNLDGAYATAESSVTKQIYGGALAEIRAEFATATTGYIRVRSVSGFPSAAPSPEGQMISTFEITPPDNVANDPGTVEVTLSRTAIEDAGAAPSDLQLVRYDDGSNSLDTLDTTVVSEDDQTVVLSAETPGFSVFGVVAAQQQATPTATATATATPEPTATEPPEPTATEPPEPTATATPEPTPTETASPTTEGDGPGFGAVVAVVAFLAMALIAGRTRS